MRKGLRMNLSLKVEFIAVIILMMLLVYNYDERNYRRNGWYQTCLYISMASVFADMLSVWAIRNADTIPVWLNMAISSINYVLISFASALLSMYLGRKIFEHCPSHYCKRRITFVISGVFLVICAAVAVNLSNGILFYFENGEYFRGPLNLLGYVALLSEVLVVGLCYMKHGDIASISMRKAMRTLPYVVCSIVVLQLLYRDMMMNGMIAAMVNLILYLSFQSSRSSLDYLTNLGNRGAFVEDLAVWSAQKKQIHILLIHLNHFGKVNREFGQKNGDEFLYMVARYINDFSSYTRAYRLGSLEFAVLCSVEDCKRIGHCLEEIMERFRKPWEIGEMRYYLSASFADLVWRGEKWDGTQIIERLEYAMNLARAQGENSWVHFDQEADRQMQHQKNLTEQIREAVAKKNFSVYYQPIYCWEDEAFCSAEALARMFDSDGNEIPPAEFIPLAESTGQILELSWIIMEKVCAFLAEHRELPLKGVTINMSNQQFMDDRMEEMLDAILKKYKIPYHLIKLEITERMISENPAKTAVIMESLNKKGIRFYLDDFGVGYSNLAGLLSLPFDTIKLDKTLTDRTIGTDKERQVVSSMVETFQRASYDIVAEGAETEDVILELKKLKVRRIQGFYYSRPLPEDEYLKFMKENATEEQQGQ